MGLGGAHSRAVFFRCLATMFAAGVPLDRCLALLVEQTPQESLRLATQDVAARVWAGSTLSEAMKRQPEFSAVQCQLIQVGESSGALAAVFARLAGDEERSIQFQEKVRMSLAAPLWIGSLCLLLAAFLPPFLFRGLLEMFRQSNTELPWATQVLMLISDFVRSPWSLLISTLLLAFLTCSRGHIRRAVASSTFQELLLALPGLGRVILMVSLTRFLHALETLCVAGVSLLESLELAAAASHNSILHSRVQTAVQEIRAGGDLRLSLQTVGLFPSAFLQGIQTGLESGHMPQMVASLSRLYEIELDHALEVLTRACEPVFLVLVGGLVGFSVIATMQPLAELVRTF